MAKKKKAKKNTLKNYFPTVCNSQGFPRNKCVFRECLNDYVYVPEKYVEEAKASPLSVFCGTCLLAPCLAQSHYHMIRKEASGLILTEGKSTLVATRRLETFMKTRMRRYFGAKYTRETGLPECVYDVIGHLIRHYVSIHVANSAESCFLNPMESDSSDSDEEEFDAGERASTGSGIAPEPRRRQNNDKEDLSLEAVSYVSSADSTPVELAGRNRGEHIQDKKEDNKIGERSSDSEDDESDQEFEF